MIKQILHDQIKTVVAASDYAQHNIDIVIELPKHAQHGDFATNMAFRLAKPLRQAPAQIAQDLCEFLSSQTSLKGLSFEPMNGFTNIRCSTQWLMEQIASLDIHNPTFPDRLPSTHIEFVSANPTGPLHVGHGRWAVIGSALAGILDYSGASVHTEFYVNDAGQQIANLYRSVDAVKNGQPVPDDGYHGDYIKELAAGDLDPVEALKNQQKELLARSGASFDTWFSEKTLVESGAVVTALDRLVELGHTYEQDDALWFRSTTWGDEKDRVLRKSDGQYTYFAVDIAYHYQKVNQGSERYINIWGTDHHGYVARVQAAILALTGLDESPLQVILGQLVHLVRDGEPVKMSKRSGDIILLEDVIDEIGVDAFRYFMAEKSPSTHLEFDLGLAASKKSENPVFYVQYAHARLNQVCEKARQSGAEPVWVPSEKNDLVPEERAVILQCIQFMDEIWECAQQRSVHSWISYLYQLARTIHGFYHACPIIQDDVACQSRRLWLAQTSQAVLAKGLSIVGISAPKSM